MFAQLSYKAQQEQSPVLIEEAIAEQAFDQAVQNAGLTLDKSYSLSDEFQRSALFDFLYQAFEQLEYRTADLGAVSGEITGDDNGGDNGNGTTPPVDGEKWNASTIYPDGSCTTVTYQGMEYQNQWWTQGNEPNPAEGDGYNSVWRFPGASSNGCP